MCIYISGILWPEDDDRLLCIPVILSVAGGMPRIMVHLQVSGWTYWKTF